MSRDDVESPGDRIRREMESRGWTQRDFAQILGRSLPTVSEVIQGKRALTPEMAVALGQAFGNDPAEWMMLESRFRLAQVPDQSEDVARRARLFDIAPVKDMEKRGWIPKTDSATVLEKELCRFFDVPSLDHEPTIHASTKRTAAGEPMNAAQRAWCFRARQLAKGVQAGPYSEASLKRAVKALQRLAAWPEEARKVSRVLADAGIRFVVVEPLPNTRIDGAAFWLDESSPVIALSVRFDRIDSFWHTLGHEISHIRHRDRTRVDADIVGENRPSPAEQDDVELRAEREAAATWIDPAELESFIVRVGPLYSKARINQFANRVRVHPGIIVGQLQYRGQLGYQACREMLVKIRANAVSEAVTDGWGHTVVGI